MFCSNCGKQLSTNDKFCSGCGTPQDNNTHENNQINKIPVETTPIETSIIKEDTKVKSPLKSMLYKCVIGAIGFCVALEIIFILTGAYFEVHMKAILSIFSIVIYGLIASNSVDLYEKTKYKDLAMWGVIIAGVGFVYTTLVTWSVIEVDFARFSGKLLWGLWIIEVGIAHSSRLLLIEFKNETAKNLLYLTNIFIFITYSMLLVSIFLEVQNEFYFRLLWIVGILSLFGTVATSLTNKIK